MLRMDRIMENDKGQVITFKITAIATLFAIIIITASTVSLSATNLENRSNENFKIEMILQLKPRLI